MIEWSDILLYNSSSENLIDYTSTIFPGTNLFHHKHPKILHTYVDNVLNLKE